MSQKFLKPFLHYSIPNFLSTQKYNQLEGVYNHLQFIEKESDLFHFFQTQELVDFAPISFFKDQLSKQFSKLVSLKNSFYNIFASYYFKGDYLLCHDDVIEDRKFAFSYYLQDHPTGQLVLYDETATKAEKKIKVTKNLLVIFEVSNISYHQVAYCSTNGRKAVTGWLNIKGLGKNRVIKQNSKFIPHIPKQIYTAKLDEKLDNQEFLNLPGVQYNFESTRQQLVGPFYERKVTKLTLKEEALVLQIPQHKLLSADFYKFQPGDYILLNDPVNTLGENILDIFIIMLPEKVKSGSNTIIQFVQQDGSVKGLPYQNKMLYAIQRKNKTFYVDRVEKPFYLAHFIYSKQQGKGKKKQINNNRPNAKAIRQKLIQKYKQEREEQQLQKESKKQVKKTKAIIKSEKSSDHKVTKAKQGKTQKKVISKKMRGK